MRGLESEFGESTNAIRIEINRFEQAGMLTSKMVGNKKVFQANTTHPLFKEVHNILLKYVGFDHIIENVIERLGDVRRVFVVGEFSKGIDSQIIDLILVGKVDTNYLVHLIEKAEQLMSRKIRYIIYSEAEAEGIDWSKYEPQPLLLWTEGQGVNLSTYIHDFFLKN